MEPTRVVINRDGEAKSPRRAKEEHGIEPDVIFVRDDGWSLGAPFALSSVAHAIWSDRWTERWVKRGDGWTQTALRLPV